MRPQVLIATRTFGSTSEEPWHILSEAGCECSRIDITSATEDQMIAAFENVGFNGLSVAFIATGSPIGCIFAGLLFSGLIYGGQTLQLTLGAPSEIINIVIGVIVFFVALACVIPPLADKLAKRGERHAK